MATSVNHSRQFFAHTVEGVTDTSRWESLAEHLANVARRAEEFASAFGAAEWGRLCGLWHDVGMLFSCLVDADFLATEEFMSPDRSAARPTNAAQFSTMQSVLSQHLDQKASSARPGTVARCRQEVLDACRDAPRLRAGLFSLTVPNVQREGLAKQRGDVRLRRVRDRVVCASRLWVVFSGGL